MFTDRDDTVTVGNTVGYTDMDSLPIPIPMPIPFPLPIRVCILLPIFGRGYADSPTFSKKAAEFRAQRERAQQTESEAKT